MDHPLALMVLMFFGGFLCGCAVRGLVGRVRESRRPLSPIERYMKEQGRKPVRTDVPFYMLRFNRDAAARNLEQDLERER